MRWTILSAVCAFRQFPIPFHLIRPHHRQLMVSRSWDSLFCTCAC
jgi:hypothetical protein